MMSWIEALDLLTLAHDSHVAHYRRLCSSANPDVALRDAVRAHVVALVTDGPPPVRVDYGGPVGPCGGCP